MQWFYLAGLIVSIAGLATLDWRYKLAFWSDARRTWYTTLSAVALFIVWDFLGIWLGIFRVGHSPLQLSAHFAPHFPFEEFFFLFLIVYSTLIIYRGVALWHSRISR